MTIKEFVELFDDFGERDGREQTDLLAYYLLSIVGQPSVSAKELRESFEILDLKPYPRLAPYLSENANNDRAGRYIKTNGEYRLVRSVSESIGRQVEDEPKKIRISKQLGELLESVRERQRHAFLKEAIDCYRVSAFRATIVMIWILTINHLASFVFNQKLAEFNAALAKNPDRRVKVVTKLEDFSELAESKFIELLRAADLISNDVRKILDEKLGIRNSAAHPSDVVFDGHKTTEFASDLVNNVLLKF